MTIPPNADTPGAMTRPADGVTVTIDGFEITVPKGTLVIRAAELLGIQVPRFCDHPLLDPVGACRQCLVHIEGQPKPPASCTTVCTDGMVVRTQLTSEVAEKAQRGVMEMLLVNHPLDCPMCDKGGECPLQNQAMSTGQGETRFTGTKRDFAKPVALSAQVLLDRERCVQCARCTRFADQIAGDPLIELLDRGPSEQVGVADGAPFDSYFSGNTVQICPVGALTSTSYRFRARPFDLVSTPSICEHCASGCRQRTDHRRGVVTRRLAGNDPQVNEEWNCDKGRWAFTYATQPDRLATPLVRDPGGLLRPASWPEAIGAAAAGLASARGRAGVLTGGRLTLEDAYAYAKFARVALGSNDIDSRARAHSAEEAQFLAARVAGRGMEVSYGDLERAPAVLLAGFEPEDESPLVFLRLRKAVRKRGLTVYSVAALASRGLARLDGVLLPAVPGTEAAALTRLAAKQEKAGTGADAAAAAAAGDLAALVVAGVDPGDLPDADGALAALAAVRFVVSLELRASAVTDRADVVLPVAAVAEKAGTFVNWEGRPGSFGAALHVPGAEPDLEVLGQIADEMDVHLGLPDAAAARRELDSLGSWQGGRPVGPSAPAEAVPAARSGQAILATWHQLLDAGRMQDGEPFLAGTARQPAALMSAGTAAEAGTADGGKVTVSTARGSVTAGVQVADMPDRVVWLPAHAHGCETRRELGAGHGTLVS